MSQPESPSLPRRYCWLLLTLLVLFCLRVLGQILVGFWGCVFASNGGVVIENPASGWSSDALGQSDH
jgi:hypothetical protein